MKTVLVDASSAILLYKATLFDSMCDTYRLAMTVAVINEITVADYAGADYFRLAVWSNRIAQIDVASAPEDVEAFPHSLGGGERDTLLAYDGSQAQFILIDDAQGARICRSRNIPHINALLCPELLYAAGRIDRQARDTAFERLLSIGRYSSEVVVYARRWDGDALSPFLPCWE